MGFGAPPSLRAIGAVWESARALCAGTAGGLRGHEAPGTSPLPAQLCASRAKGDGLHLAYGKLARAGRVLLGEVIWTGSSLAPKCDGWIGKVVGFDVILQLLEWV